MTLDPRPRRNLRVATSNIQARLRDSAVRADLRTIWRLRPHVWNFQEIGSGHLVILRAVLVTLGYRIVVRSSVPIAYRRRRFVKIRAWAYYLSAATPVGKEGPGPSTLREKHATVLMARDKKRGNIAFFINCHLAPSPYLNDERDELHTEQITALAALVKRLVTNNPSADIYLAGDLNTPDRTRLRPLARAGLRLGEVVDTHGRRQLDYVLSTVKAKDYEVIKGLNTDHNGLVVTF